MTARTLTTDARPDRDVAATINPPCQPRAPRQKTFHATTHKPGARPTTRRSTHPNRSTAPCRNNPAIPTPRQPGRPTDRTVSPALQEPTELPGLRIHPHRHCYRPTGRTTRPPDSTTPLPSVRTQLGRNHPSVHPASTPPTADTHSLDIAHQRLASPQSAGKNADAPAGGVTPRAQDAPQNTRLTRPLSTGDRVSHHAGSGGYLRR